MFADCTSLSDITGVDIKEVPKDSSGAIDVTAMFYGCTSLVDASSLNIPANTRTSYMFRGCTSLQNPPTLPGDIATSGHYSVPPFYFNDGAYECMFSDCSSLKTAPELPATELTSNCYVSMFSNCISLVNPPELPATELADRCYAYMFDGCHSLKDAPELPATSLASDCYVGMFFGCKSLEEAPELVAEELVRRCYYKMFSGCVKLRKIIVHFHDWGHPHEPCDGWLSSGSCDDSDNYTYMWVSNVSKEGEFECPPDLALKEGICYVPVGWLEPWEANADNAFCIKAQTDGTIELPEGLPLMRTDVSSDWGEEGRPADTPIVYWMPHSGVINIKAGESVKFFAALGDADIAEYTIDYLKTTCDVALSGDIQSLYALRDTCPARAFRKLFMDNKHIKDVGSLNMTARNVGDSAYYCMFTGTDITTGPKYYSFIFDTLLSGGVDCMCNMYSYCSELKQASIPAIRGPLSSGAMSGMFTGCAKLITVTGTIDTSYGGDCRNMFKGCASLTKAPNITGSTVPAYFFTNAFAYCTSLEEVPKLPAINLGTHCYDSMFSGCTALSKLEVSFTEWHDNATANWVLGVNTICGEFIAPSSLALEYGTSRIPQSWDPEQLVEKYFEDDIVITLYQVRGEEYDENGQPIDCYLSGAMDTMTLSLDKSTVKCSGEAYNNDEKDKLLSATYITSCAGAPPEAMERTSVTVTFGESGTFYSYNITDYCGSILTLVPMFINCKQSADFDYCLYVDMFDQYIAEITAGGFKRP
jgi:hypothetical protein